MSDKKLAIELLALVPKKDHAEFRQKWASARQVLEVLKQAIEKKELEKRKGKAEDYDKPSWAYYAADKNGYLRAVEEIKNLL